MKPRAYYNEIDPAAAHVLECLVRDGVIADGDVDRRSIRDVSASDLDGYTQCHFFAGGGLWSVAARLAGWPDERPLWTGSCPCQGESLAGKRLGADDPRHLWPDFFRLIRARRPAVVVGEQVAAAAGTHWLDRVCADLEDEDYAMRAVDIPACAVDAPHQRQRLYWVAVDDGKRTRLEGQHGDGRDNGGRPITAGPVAAADDLLLADATGFGRGERRSEHEFRSWGSAIASGDALLQSDPDCGGRTGWPQGEEWSERRGTTSERLDGGLCTDADKPLVQGQSSAGKFPFAQSDASAFRNGSWWAGAEWIVSPLDGKARRSKPGISFLVNGLPGRVGLWRVGGNAIVPILAAEVIASLSEYLEEAS